MKVLVGAFNQERALDGAFSVIVQLRRLIICSTNSDVPCVGALAGPGRGVPGVLGDPGGGGCLHPGLRACHQGQAHGRAGDAVLGAARERAGEQEIGADEHWMYSQGRKNTSLLAIRCKIVRVVNTV